MLKYIYLILIFNSVHSISNSWPNYYLYTQSRVNYTIVTPDNITLSDFKWNKETKFLIHGYSDNGFQSSLLQIKDSILKLQDVNVLVLDWEEGAKGTLKQAADHAKITGEDLGEFISGASISTSRIHCIGHGLGAHSCGFAGKLAKLNRISGLDPAGLYFEGDSSTRLDKSDADFVDIIHADGVTGIEKSIGHKDYYPNGGKVQPGCKFDPLDLFSCSHKRVINYYAESIISPVDCIFFAIRCDSYDQYKSELYKCDCGSNLGCPGMGYFDTIEKGQGNFYLETKPSSPYCVH